MLRLGLTSGVLGPTPSALPKYHRARAVCSLGGLEGAPGVGEVVTASLKTLEEGSHSWATDDILALVPDQAAGAKTCTILHLM